MYYMDDNFVEAFSEEDNYYFQDIAEKMSNEEFSSSIPCVIAEKHGL